MPKKECNNNKHKKAAPYFLSPSKTQALTSENLKSVRKLKTAHEILLTKLDTMLATTEELDKLLQEHKARHTPN